MYPNSLYAVLKQLLITNPRFVLLDKISPNPDTTTKGSHYYRLKLPVSKVEAEDLRLEEAHVSIFEKIDKQKPTLSPSHFTAIFRDSGDQAFRMHLFLDINDSLACPPSWEKLDADGQYIKLDPPACIDFLINEIGQRGLSCLQALRQQKRQLEAELTKVYSELEVQTALLSRNLPGNKDTYLERLEQMRQPVEILSLITDKFHWSSRMIGYIHRLQILVASMPKNSTESVDEASMDTTQAKYEAQTASVPSKKETRNQKPPQSTLFSGKNKENSKVFAENQGRINKLSGMLQHAKINSDERFKADCLIHLNNQLALVLLQVKLDLLTFNQVNALRRIESGLANEAKKLLQRALITKDFDLAKKLSPFYAQIDEKMIILALVNKDAELLGFLASNVSLAINSDPITIKEENYPNAVAYCFETALSACFSALIDNGASLMIAAGPDKLPIAHLILSAGSRHPLYGVFEKNKDKTLRNQTFFQYLIMALNNAIDSHHLTPEKAASVNKSIEYYKECQKRADFQTSFLSRENNILADELSALAKNKLPEGLAQALEADKDIRSVRTLLEGKLKKLQKKNEEFRKSTGKSTAFQSSITENYSDFKKLLSSSNPDVKIEFSAMKHSVLKTVGYACQMIDYCIELIDVQLALHKSRNKKHIKNLLSRNTSLIQEIETLQKKMPHKVLNEHHASQEQTEQLAAMLKDSIDAFEKLENGYTILSDLLKNTDGSPDDISTVVHQRGGPEKFSKEVIENLDGLIHTLRLFGNLSQANQSQQESETDNEKPPSCNPQ